MNLQQKRAWFNLAVVALVGVGWLIFGLTVTFQYAWVALALILLSAFSCLIGRGQKWDERDITIQWRAFLVGGLASYLVLYLGCTGILFFFFIGKNQDQIPVYMMGYVIMAGAMAFFISCSITTLVLYNRHVEADHA